MYTTAVLCCFQFELLLERNTLLHALPTKSSEMLARDVFDIFVTHSGLVHDVTDTDSGTQNATLMVVFSRLSNADC